MSKSGDQKRAERLKAALRDNLKRRKAQIKARVKARSQAAKGSANGRAMGHDSAGISGEIAQTKPKG